MEERKIEKEALQQLDLTAVLKEAGDFFSHIQKALIILLTLPCTTAIERTFSTLRRVKKWLRSTKVGEMLNGLCTLSVHRKIVFEMKLIVKEKVLEVLCKQKRRLSLK